MLTDNGSNLEGDKVSPMEIFQRLLLLRFLLEEIMRSTQMVDFIVQQLFMAILKRNHAMCHMKH